MMNNYSYESMEIFNSLSEDFSIWECRLMILEHNMIISEESATQERLNNARDKVIDTKLSAEKKFNNAKNTIIDKKKVLKSAVNKLLDLFQSISAKFTGIFRKFKEVSIRLFRSNEKWLAKYKNDILSADLSKLNYEHEIFAYWEGIQYMAKLTPRSFNKNDTSMMNALESVDKYREYLINKHIPIKAKQFKGDNFNGNLKTVFRGGRIIKLKGAQLQDHLEGMFKFCMSYKDISNELNSQLKNITQACKEAETEVKIGSNKASAAMNNTSNNSTDPNNSKENINKSESYFLFYEANDLTPSNKDIQRNNKDKFEQVKNDTNKNTSLVSKDEKQVTKAATGKDATSSSDVMDIANRYKNYLNVNTTILSSKLEVVEERYHAYMNLLRAIVDISLKQSNREKKKGDSYNNRTDQIEDSKLLSDKEKERKLKQRKKMK